MICHAHIIAWNREETIHWTIQHYLSFCDKVILYDNHSTDNTVLIAKALGAEIRFFGVKDVLGDDFYLDVKNHAWRGSEADWVIVVDDDEILWHPNLVEELQFARDSGATIIKPQGIGIFSNEMPVNDWTDLMTGVHDDNYSKLCCFNPTAIEEIGYIFGCHQARPKGRIRQVDKLFLLHYRAVGGVQRLIDRHRLYEPRRQKSEINMRWNLGHHYSEDENKKIEWFNEQSEKSNHSWLGGTRF